MKEDALRLLFDYNSFAGNEELDGLINDTATRYGSFFSMEESDEDEDCFLSMEELDWVAAAGEYSPDSTEKF